MKRFADNGSALDREDRASRDGGADLLDILDYPNLDRDAGPLIFVVRREDYVYLVPFVEDEHTVFLKTIIPSRKATRGYVGEEFDDEA